MPYRHQPPVLLGIIGDSGSGKSTLSSGVEQILGPERASDICLDDYHRYDRAERAALQITALDPECNHLELMRQHLLLLRKGETIFKPNYDHRDGTFGRPALFTPKQLVILHGLLGLHSDALKQCFHVSIFLDPDPELRVQWKIQRDCSKRGYTPEEVRKQLAHRETDAQRFIMPQRARADLTISFYPQPGYWSTRDNRRLNVRIVEAHGMPEPDLGDIAQEAKRRSRAEHGRPHFLIEEPTRALGGRTIDIDGDIPDDLAYAAEEALWEQMPGVRHLRPESIGNFVQGGGVYRSHTLALTQLLVTYQIVQAAEGMRVQLAAAAAAL
jgi:phosphoribulokinase